MAIDINNLGSGANTRTENRTKTKPDNNTANENAAQSKAPAGDSVQLTDTANKLRQLEQNLADVPVSNQDRVEAVKQAINEGSYQIDTLSIANKMLNFERSLG